MFGSQWFIKMTAPVPRWKVAYHRMKGWILCQIVLKKS